MLPIYRVHIVGGNPVRFLAYLSSFTETLWFVRLRFDLPSNLDTLLPLVLVLGS